MRVLLDVSDHTIKLTLWALLEKDGHVVGEGGAADVVICGDARRAVGHARSGPTLLLASMGQIGEAVRAMRKGVYGYIFVPLQPGEAGLMVERAAGAGVRSGDEKFEGTMEDAEARLILSTLRQCKYNRTKTARALGIGRNTLWRKMKKMMNDE